MKTIRVGIVGVGQIGKSHLQNYAKIPGVAVVAATDINEAELKRVAEEHKIPNTYTDFRKMLQRDDLDSVDVCLHNNFHAPVTIAALRAGKNVYCEKPMAGAYVDAKAMYDEARKLRRKLSIQLSTVFAKETKVARHLIQHGRLGKLYHARSTGYRRRGRPFVDGYGAAPFVKKKIAAGGALYDVGVYHIAQLLFLLNMPAVERVSGKTYQEIAMDAKRGKLSGFDVEELGLGFVKFAGGLTLDIIESWAIHMGPFEGSFIVGSKGGVRLQPFSFHCTTEDIEIDATSDINAADWRWHRLEEKEYAYDSPQQHWIAAQQGVVDLLPTDAIALETMLISEGIYMSDRLGREVTAAEVLAKSRSTAVKL